MKKCLFILLCLLLPLIASAQTKAEADSAYAKEQYKEAAALYEALLKQGKSVDLYYNLGNCYYRTDNMPRAVLNYERALLLSPGDNDVRFNLGMARGKTIDRITPASEMFFITWLHQLINIQSSDAWARTAIVAFVFTLLAFLLYAFGRQTRLKKIGFFIALFSLVAVVVSNIFAYQQREALRNRTNAIVMTSAVMVKSTPNESGTDLFVLHEGTKVQIVDDGMKGWKEIRLADGKEGWIPAADMERI